MHFSPLICAAGGPKNIIPGIIVMSGFGYAGQRIYEKLDERSAAKAEKSVGRAQESMWKQAFRSRWSPVKLLSDDEYEKMLQEKVLRIDAEISLIDERIGVLKQKSMDSPAKNDQDSS